MDFTFTPSACVVDSDNRVVTIFNYSVPSRRGVTLKVTHGVGEGTTLAGFYACNRSSLDRHISEELVSGRDTPFSNYPN
jgi:hypothetical protein